jgi:nucleolar protein 9
MPREFRKRGKKTKNTTDKKPKDDLIPHEDHHEEPRAGPSWIIPASNDSGEVNLDAPFGYLDADVKAYFRTVDVQIRNWQESDVDAGETNEDVDPNEGT